jgi:3'-5' exoribonuclease
MGGPATLQVVSRPHTDIRNFTASAYVEGVYSIVNPQVGITRAGKSYLKCLLRDATGEVVTRQWSFDESALSELSSAGFVWAAGHTQLYNGQVQFIVEQIKPVEVDEEELAALVPSTSGNIDEMFQEVRSILGTLHHPAMKALADVYLADEELMASFRRCPAATSLHHAFIGGLLEHTLQLLKLADVMLPLYPVLNRDFVLMALFLHDLGKTVELSWEKGFDYTTEGNLIGHTVRGVIWLQIKAAIAAKQTGVRLPGDALRVLQHMILSHHGQLEHGAPKLPSTPEAVFVSMLDDLDAKTAMALSNADRDHPAVAEAAAFTDKVWALGTRIYRRDPLKDS